MKRVSQLSIFLMLLTSISCLDDADCLNLNNNVVGISFKNGDGTAHPLTVTAVTAEGATDTLAQDVTASKFALPLNYTENQTTYTFSEADTSYSIVMTYETQSQFVSQACGQRFVLSNLEVVDHPFDSIRMVSRTPGINTSANNVELFFE
jgi:hypothetical protein